MKAVVLAGGYATRLWPITKHRPKMLLPVGETTVIDRIFSALEADERIEEVYVSTNERFADAFEQHLADQSFEKPVVSVEETTEEAEKFGVVGALGQLVEREGIDDDLLVVAGDNLIGFDLSEFIDYFQQKETAVLAAYDVGDREKAKSYGLVELDGDRVVDFQEKPAEPNSTLVSIACYAFPQESIRFEEYLSGGNNPDEPGWFIQWLQNQEPVSAFVFDEPWFDIGTPESYLEAVAWTLGGDSVIAESATVERSTIGENVQVMAGAEIADATLDRSVVFEDAVVEGCEIHETIIDEGTHLEGIDLAGALIGAHTQLTNGVE
ncbi:sugar nucleotidyltransferase [Natronomonas pharaonis DSM 2160]|uniref:Sugar nucleotidyltransferase n=1 Tax=Natronomonas pharaonis (strain ATCC 35678 / DSM 2160 / CIP 103997 / JCM 8858 / NBRC 14720 / NCIMB 2260 / Gabara) TaxID=348780 RepID=A0A1U7ETN6_NATPD|nr:NDP-sugar synthase [Natronomonas pharaonis]CAI48283.1 sugar nucleotidyltransferase [Natronomonas pharaonis DSM 2160]